MSLNKEFFQVFKKLENLLRLNHSLNHYEYNDSFISQFNKLAEQDSRLNKYKKDIYIIKNMRNFKAHNPNVDEYYLVTEKSISTIQSIIDIIENPKKAFDIAIKESKIYKRKLNDLVVECMEEMKKKLYTHVPIFDEDNTLLGVFSDNAFFNYYIDNKVRIDTKMKFKDLIDYIDIDKHIDETFAFINKEALMSDVEAMFKKPVYKDKRIELVFITNSGKLDEAILGMITPWDLLR